MTVFARLFKLFIIVIITPLFVTGVFLFYYQNYSKTEILTNYLNLAQISSSFIKQNIENITLRFDPINEASTLLETNKKSVQRTLDNTLENSPDFVFLAILDSSGKELIRSASKEISANMAPIDLSGDTSLKRITSDNIAISSFDRMTPFPFVEIVYPTKDGKYLFAVVNLFSVWEKFSQQPIGATGGIYFAEAAGGFLNFNDALLPVISAESIETALTADTFLIKDLADINGDHFVGAFAPTPIPGTYLLVLQFENEAFYTISLITWLIVFFILATTTLSYFAALSFSQEVSSPIEALTEAATKMSDNNFNVYVNPDGSWGEFEILINTVNNMAKRLGEYQAVQLDKLLDEKKKIDLLAGLMRDGIIMCSTEGKRMFINKTAANILDSDALCNDIVCHVKNGKKKPKIKDLLSLPSGTIFTYSKEGQPAIHYEMVIEVFKPANQEDVAIMIFRDITTEHEINQMKNDIFNSVAHDLRAPLLGLQASIMIMGEGVPEAKQKELLKSMEQSSLTLTSLIENILDASKLERGVFTITKKDFDLSEAVQKTVDTLRPLAEEKHLYLKNNVAEGITLRADRNLIERVLTNLISNALKFTEEGGIDIFYTSSKKAHKVTVSDSGIGIKEEDLHKVFDKYHQADKKEKGYGLGLTIAKQIIEAHEGEIGAYAKKGPGAQITFSLPKEDNK